ISSANLLIGTTSSNISYWVNSINPIRILSRINFAFLASSESVKERISPVSGTIQSIEVEAGTLVTVGDNIMVIDDGSEGGEEEPASDTTPDEEDPVEEVSEEAPEEAPKEATGVVATSDPNK